MSGIGSIIKIKVAKLKMLYVIESANLNIDTFNKSTGFHILFDFGLH